MSRCAPPQPLGDGLVCRPFRVDDTDVVWLRSILEAYEGLAFVYGDGSGVIDVIGPADRVRELDSLLGALVAESRIRPL
ncbi:MAG: DUF4911 domain-containing protein [Myxococcales bacterium]|nr:DUF4911 domain-containing protein [Myxococcales bacterium]